MALFLEPIMPAARTLLLVIDLEALPAVSADVRKRTGAKVGDKGNGATIRTIAYTKLFTFGQARVS